MQGHSFRLGRDFVLKFVWQKISRIQWETFIQWKLRAAASNRKRARRRGDVISTNADGIAQSPELCLGKYEVREIAAGEFYAVSDYVYETELTYDRAEISVEAELFVEE